MYRGVAECCKSRAREVKARRRAVMLYVAKKFRKFRAGNVGTGKT